MNTQEYFEGLVEYFSALVAAGAEDERTTKLLAESRKRLQIVKDREAKRFAQSQARELDIMDAHGIKPSGR